jgi:TonB family protein
MKKYALLFVACCCIFLKSSAQQEITSYLKNNGFLVNYIDSADYIRIVKPSDLGAKIFLVEEFYRSGKRKSIGYTKWPRMVVYEGSFKSFFENGNPKQSMTYSENKIIDSVYSFFPNGKLYSVQAYQKLKDSTITFMSTVKDSTGNTLVSDGNGTAVLYDENFEYITGKGNFRNGKMDGEWNGEVRNADTLSYKETYADGVMLSGESTNGKGNIYHYTVSNIEPRFKGSKDFYRFVGMQVRYPPHLARQHIQGTVHIIYTILKNGEISNIHATEGDHPDLAAEGVRILKTAQHWSPAIVKGRKVDMTFSMPMAFTLDQ